MNIEKVYGKTKKKIERALGRELKGLDDIKSEQEYEDLSLTELVKMNFTLRAHTQAVVQLIKKKKGGKVKTVNYTYEKRKEVQ